MNAKNVLAVIGALALVVVFRSQIVTIINAINTAVSTPPAR